jgi:HAD superfamily hydrolase (TIGR01484 family)
MRYHAIVTDFDGTLAKHGQVSQETVDHLQQIQASGRRLIMATGRRLEPLLALCPWIDLFQWVIAENGALLYSPESGEETLLSVPPPIDLIVRMQQAGVEPVESGRIIVATWQPHHHVALQVIRELGLDWQIIFNKDAVMLLPSGCNKATGLQAALQEMGLSPLNIVAVGDAENDEAMLRIAGVSVAVKNAVPAVQSICDIVTTAERGEGVSELCRMILDDDLERLRTRPDRCISLGWKVDNEPLLVPLYGDSIFVTGEPAGGKSKLATSFLQQAQMLGAQCCIVDPEGDYCGLKNSVTIGTIDRAPAIEEVIELLDNSSVHCVVCFFAVEKKERPHYFNKLFRALSELRSRTGLPHWIIIDEAHYMAPASWQPAEEWNQDELKSFMFVTAYPDRISKAVLQSVEWIVSVSENPSESLVACCERMGVATPTIPMVEGESSKGSLAWRRGTDAAVWFNREIVESEAKRHRKSLMDGEMDESLQFVFRGPEKKLTLKAKNLREFMRLAEGLDDGTWDFHLRERHYSQWFREVVKDQELADVAEEIEKAQSISPKESRSLIFDEINARF